MNVLTVARAWLASLGICVFTPTAAANTWHVDASRAPGGDGAAWSSAFRSLDAALESALDGDQIWVARGRYYPTLEQQPGQPRSASFAVPEGVALYGGFAGHELTLDARAGLFEETALSGDIGMRFDASDNAEHVVLVSNPSGIPRPVRVDGFTIVAGSGYGGAGLRSFNSGLTVANCIFEDNAATRGGAIYAEAGILRVKWCRFRGNRASEQGGAIWGRAVTLRIYHSTFADNQAGLGGAMFVHSVFDPSAVQVASCEFRDNSAQRGGAVHVGAADLTSGHGTWTNCTFAYNRAAVSGGAFSIRDDAARHPIVIVRNSIVWGNSAPLGAQIDGRALVNYSNVQDRCCGPGNVSSDPLFVDVPGRDLRLRSGSPSVDAGANVAVALDWADVDGDGFFGGEQTELDAAGQERFADDPGTADSGAGSVPLVDMGAYELVP